MEADFDDYQIKMELLTANIYPENDTISVSSNNKISEILKKLNEQESIQSDKSDYDTAIITKGKVNQIKENLAVRLNTPPPVLEKPKPIDYSKKKLTLIKNCEELYQTELRYTEILRILNNIFTDVERSNLPRKVEICKILKDIPSLYQLHILISEKLSKLNQDEALLDFPSIFMEKEIIAYLRMYKEFLTKYENNANSLATIYVSEKDFQVICKHNTDQSIFENQKAQDLPGMFLQIQSRLTRYKLLLKDIIKNTPPEDPNKKIAQTASDNFDNLLKEVEAGIIRDKATREANLVSQKLEGRKNKCEHYTIFIKSGPAKKIPRRSLEKKSLDRHLFLFSDYLVITEPQNVTGSYNVKVELTLVNAELISIDEDDEIPFDHCFRIKSIETTLEIAFQSEGELNDWWSHIEEAINAERKRKDTYQSNTNSASQQISDMIAASWIKDEHSTMCTCCYKPFTPIRRKHHCRACGFIFCSACSAFTMDLKNIGNNVRVCGICYYTKNPKAKPNSAKWIERIGRRSDINDLMKPLKTGYLKVAKCRNRQWECKHMTVNRTSEDIHEYDQIEHKSHEAGENLSLVAYFPKPKMQTEMLSLQRCYCALHRDSAMQMFAGSADSKAKDSLVLMGVRIFYLVPKKQERIKVKDTRNNSFDQSLTLMKKDTFNSLYKSTRDPNNLTIALDQHRRSQSEQEGGAFESHIYENPISQQSNSSTSQSLSSLTPVSRQFLSVLRNNHCFLIMPPKSETIAYYFEASSQSMRDLWIQMIRESVYS